MAMTDCRRDAVGRGGDGGDAGGSDFRGRATVGSGGE